MTTSKLFWSCAITACIIVGILFMGCVEAPKKPGYTITVVDKFSAVGQCNFGSATEYYILGNNSETYLFATTCQNAGIPDPMKYYSIWQKLNIGDPVEVSGFRRG